MPTVVVLALSWYMNRSLASTQEKPEYDPDLKIENINISIFKGKSSLNYTVKNTSTPMRIAQDIYKEQFKDKKVTISANGRKLNNEMSVGLQGVRNGDFIQIKFGELHKGSHKTKDRLKVVLYLVAVFGMWWGYFCYSEEFSFLLRSLLVLCTEVLCLAVYKNLNRV